MPAPHQSKGTGSADGWLSLGRACQLLGVNETTLRRWADEGRVRTFRTPGGHRRFAEADIRALLDAPDTPRDAIGAVGDAALARIRRRLQGRQVTSAHWHQDLDETARLRMRALGRRLIALADEHLAARRGKARLLVEARALGHEYGLELAAGGLPLSTTVEAFTFFRRSLEETVAQLAARHSLTPDRSAEAHDHIAQVADAVLIAITRAYEDQQKETGRWPS